MSTRATLYNVHRADFKPGTMTVKEYNNSDDVYDILNKELILFDWFVDPLLKVTYSDNRDDYVSPAFSDNIGDDDCLYLIIDKEQFWNFIKFIADRYSKRDSSTNFEKTRLNEDFNRITLEYMDDHKDNKWQLTSNSLGMNAILQLIHIYKVMDWDNDFIFLHIG